MNGNLENAKLLLKQDGRTLAAVNGEKRIISNQRGIHPLLDLLEEKQSLRGFSAADKVVGKAAALLYVLLEPDEIYAEVISEAALNVLTQNGIKTEYKILAAAIRNRSGTGFCPMETAVRGTEDPRKALTLIREKLSELS